jgi:hypothetical protein
MTSTQNQHIKEESNQEKIHKYIEIVQEAVASLSKVKDSDPGQSYYLIFEILHRAQDKKEEKLYFRAHISEKVYSPKNITNEQIKYYCSKVKTGIFALDKSKNAIENVFREYENLEIKTDQGTTGLIYKAWCKGILFALKKDANKKEIRNIKNALFLQDIDLSKNIAKICKDELKLKVIVKQITKNALILEKVFVHKIFSNQKPLFGSVIHFPLIVHDFWFIGQAYLVKVGKIGSSPPMLFDKDKYLRCYDILVNTVAEPLRWALQEEAISKFNPERSLEDNVLEAAKEYFACFDVEPCKFPCRESPDKIIVEYKDKGIRVKIPSWENISDRFKNKIEKTLKDEIDELEVEIKKKWDFFTSSRKSAVAAIMSRNMSHNIGSHVTPRTSMESVRRKLRELVFSEGGELKEADSFNIVSGLKLSLEEYIQKKADFLAEITTEPLSSTKPVSFYRDVLRPFIENTLLMDNIVTNEGVGFASFCNNRLKIYVTIDNKKIKLKYYDDKRKVEYRYPPKLPYSLCDIITHKPLTATILGSNDIEVDLPGPLGEYAFYGLIENYIRNVAKHNRQRIERKRKEDFQINLRIKDYSKNHYKVELSSNFNIYNEKVFKKIEKYINGDIIDLNGRLNREAWGIGEMKICATLLRGSKNYGSENMAKSLEILRRGNKLVHRFYMMKSKKVCAVISSMKSKGKINHLKEKGIYIFNSIDELKKGFNHSLDGPTKSNEPFESIASFQFALFDYFDIENRESDLTELLEALPFRILIFNCPIDKSTGRIQLNGANKELFNSRKIFAVPDKDLLDDSPSIIFARCWNIWLKRWLGNEKKANVVVYLDQTEIEEPTINWKDYSRSFNKKNTNIMASIFHRASRENKQSISGISHNIYFDRHTIGLKKIFPNFNDHTSLFLRNDSYIPFDKKSSDFTSLFSPLFPSSLNDIWIYPYQLVEAGLLRILVIDERVTEAATKEVPSVDDIKQISKQIGYNYYDITPFRWNLALGAKVFICTHFVINLGKPIPIHHSVSSRRFGQYLHLNLKIENKKLINIDIKGKTKSGEYLPLKDPIDMLIIHQGVLERDDIKSAIDKDTLLESLRKYIPFVIVDSGRGIPPNIFKSTKFLPFSLLQNFMMSDRIAKFSLAQVAMSLTRITDMEQ